MTLLEKWTERKYDNEMDNGWYGQGVARNIYDEVIEDVKFLEARILLLEARLFDFEEQFRDYR